MKFSCYVSSKYKEGGREAAGHVTVAWLTCSSVERAAERQQGVTVAWVCAKLVGYTSTVVAGGWDISTMPAQELCSITPPLFFLRCGFALDPALEHYCR